MKNKVTSTKKFLFSCCKLIRKNVSSKKKNMFTYTWNICSQIYTTVTQHDSHCIATTWFQGSTTAQPENFAKNIIYTTLVQPDFCCICKTWFKLSTVAQPEIFIFMVKWHILHYTCTPWFSLHLQNMISVTYNYYYALCFLICIYIYYWG